MQDARRHWLVAQMMVVGLLALPRYSIAQSQLPLHLLAAQDLVSHVAPTDTNYEHQRGTVVWGNATTKYQCHTDCSGLLNHLLAQVYGVHEGDVRGWFGTGRPTAKTYHDAIQLGNHFTRVTNIRMMQPGDIIAIKYPEGSVNTGHVMLVAETPRQHSATEPLRAATLQWEVPVIDSSMSGHGKTDTRRQPDGSYRDGLGKGVIRIYTDPQGAFAGYTWSTSGTSDYYGQQDRHLEVGRLKLK